MALLARRNLSHNRIRFAVTLTGIVFALVLIIIQFGLFLGFTTTAFITTKCPYNDIMYSLYIGK